MLWVSDVVGRDGKPAVLLLSVTRERGGLVAEAAYVAAELPEGALPGRYYRTEGAEPTPVTVVWPGGWPTVTPTNKIHPRADTPEAAVATVDGARVMQLAVL